MTAIEKTIQRIALERYRLQEFQKSFTPDKLLDILGKPENNISFHTFRLQETTYEAREYYYEVLKRIYGRKAGFNLAHFYLNCEKSNYYPDDSIGRYFHAVDVYQRHQRNEIERLYHHLDQLIRAEVNKIRKEKQK